jgi:hypothetical protein
MIMKQLAVLSLFVCLHVVVAQREGLFSKFWTASNYTYASTSGNGAPSTWSEILAAIQVIKGTDCCNECLFLPDLMPCANFLGPIGLSIYTPGSGYNGNQQRDVNILFRDFAQWDDQTMCFQRGGQTPWVPFGLWYQNPSYLSGSTLALLIQELNYDEGNMWQGCVDTQDAINNNGVCLLCGPNTITNDGPYNQKCTGGDTPEWQAQRMQWCVPYSNIMAHTSYGQHTAIQGATQFVYTYLFQPYTGPGSFSNTAWTSVYHYQGRSPASTTTWEMMPVTPRLAAI